MSSPADNKREKSAHAAHASDHAEDEGVTVGSTRIRTVPTAAHASLRFGLQLDSGEHVLASEETVSV